MGLSRQQIEDWSQRPSTFLPDWTKTVLEEALDDAPQLRDKCQFETFLQGSYINETNIHGSSDVDLVVQMRLPFEEEISDLGPADAERFWVKYGMTHYGWLQFRADVLARLRQSFFVHEGNKCIDIRHFDSLLRIPADVVPSVEYRRYSAFPTLDDERYEEGMFFRDRAGRAIINFPKQHLRNGRLKDADADGQFKSIVRVFKNARNACEDFDAEQAPSYFVECLVFNIPTELFRHPLDEAYVHCLRWLNDSVDELPAFDCVNGLLKLFGDGGHQWRVAQARRMIDSLVRQLG